MTSPRATDVPITDPLDRKPPPVEHIGSSSDSHPSTPSASRPTSLLEETPSRLKSSSVSQPIQPPSASRHRHTASTVPQRLSLEDTVSEDVPLKEADFLTELASRERRVLELKDELKRAEAELANLKKNWANQEAMRRRSEGRKLHAMRPMSVSHVRVPKADDPDGSSAWMYEEMERRKALMGHARTSSRRVFSGSRHVKTLSLVPAQMREEPEVPDESPVNPNAESGDTSKRSADLTRKMNPSQFLFSSRKDSASPQREVFQTGKQLAAEWRDGLWTFFEDLKQATVGDDQIATRRDGPGHQRQNSNVEASKTWTNLIPRQQSTKPHDDSTLADVASTFWNEHALVPAKDGKRASVAAKKPVSQTPQKTTLHVREYEGESWETWDSPDAKQSSPALSSEASTARSANSASPPASSPATSNEATPKASLSKRDSIPWPALTKFGPESLRRTASHLMQEWERSLTPPAEGESSRRPSIPEGNEEGQHDLIS